MAAPAGIGRQSLNRAAIAIVSVLSLSGLGIISFNRPGTQTFEVTATCQSVRLPHGFKVDLGHEYQSILLQGFAGRFEHIEAASTKGVRQPLPADALELVPQQATPTDAPASLKVAVQKLGGTLSVDARNHLYLGLDGRALELQFGPGTVVTFSAGALKLSASRFQNPVPETVASSVATVNGRFQAPPTENRAALHATWEAGSIAFSGAGGSAIAADKGQILASDCTDYLMQVSGSESPVQIKREAAKLGIEANRYEFKRISLLNPASAARASIQFKVSGEGTSVTEDGREALPSALKQILDGKPYQLGLFGTLIIFLIFAGATILKRAIDVFVKRLIPD